MPLEAPVTLGGLVMPVVWVTCALVAVAPDEVVSFVGGRCVGLVGALVRLSASCMAGHARGLHLVWMLLAHPGMWSGGTPPWLAACLERVVHPDPALVVMVCPCGGRI